MDTKGDKWGRGGGGIKKKVCLTSNVLIYIKINQAYNKNVNFYIKALKRT